ncbi:MAG: hypothetical protein CSA81_11715 [Acidobacteria bacterium]|nr:MAG: hypothetical protein CSA81_11715 [Acidobacteriota bacterium]
MKSKIISKLPVLIAAVLMIVIYNLPIWWVSLTAPNYPEEAFPDGVKIHFHFNGVFNGCKQVEKDEIHEDQSLDCVHEMDTINHYVGMYPIAAGGAVEVAFSVFLIALAFVMLISYACDDSRRRMIIQIVGFSVIVIWMILALYVPGGLKYQTSKYLEGRVAALGQEDSDISEDLSPGEALIASLKSSLESSGVEVEGEKKEELSQKEKDIAFLKDAFETSQTRLAIQEKWNGSGAQLLSWHYRANLARYFNDPAKISPMVKKIQLATHVAFVLILIIMAVLVIGSRKTDSLIYKLLILVPMALPVIFVVFYAVWLSWYGHNMNDMGAFTLKAFMPTVFGQGKVAQFTTNSYPHIGFFLMLLSSALLGFSFINQRKKSGED